MLSLILLHSGISLARGEALVVPLALFDIHLHLKPRYMMQVTISSKRLENGRERRRGGSILVLALFVGPSSFAIVNRTIHNMAGEEYDYLFKGLHVLPKVIHV